MTITPRIPRLSIIIPTLNRAELVRRALDSALAQTCRDIEILVSNNGSRDHTRQVLEGYSDPRLRVFQREDTIPACVHGNFLVEEARGEFLLGLSDDDFLEPDFAERVMALFDRHPGLAFVYTCCWRHYGDVRVPTPTGPEIESGPDFIAGFLAGLVRGLPPAQVMNLASGAGACCCEAADATGGMRSLEDIQRRIAAGWARLPLAAPRTGWAWDEDAGIFAQTE